MKRLLLFALAALIACSGGDEDGDEDVASAPDGPLEIPAGCNPIAADWDCLLPFPSDTFRQPDATLPSGFKVVYPAEALPSMDAGDPVDPTHRHPADGFSHLSPILVVIPGGVDATDLVFHTGDVSRSQGQASPTVLLDAETGARILHFAEVDPEADDPDRAALLIRPMVRLANGRRYIVALRGLSHPDGSAVAPPEAFRRLRDVLVDPADTVLTPLATRYDAEIFPPLVSAGVARESLILAWDFTTESLENVTRDLLAVRTLTMAAMEAAPPAVTLTEVTDDVDETILRRIEGTITVPLFMETEEPGALLHRGPDGAVAQNGTVEVPFLAIVPRSAEAAGTPLRALQFGHGFFGDRFEVVDNFVFDFANQTQMVVFAVDWWGMSEGDVADVVTPLITDPKNLMTFTERIHQGMANQIALSYAIKSSFTTDKAFLATDGKPFHETETATEDLYFYGISQGHILGGTYAALTPNTSRIALGVGGAGFTFMMFRAKPFVEFLGLLKIPFPGALDRQKVIALTQTVFDRIDPITYAPIVSSAPWPDSPPDRRVLMQLGVGDSQVPNLAAHIHARALGLSLMTPAPRPVPDLPEVTAPFDGSALAEYDFGVQPPLPDRYATPPQDETVSHEAVRRSPHAIAQIDAFFQPESTVIHDCDGACLNLPVP